MSKPHTIVVVGCGASKLDAPAPAAQLYTSTLFRLSYEYAQAIGDDVVIASALHGLVEPGRVLDPYECRLQVSDDIELRKWSLRFAAALMSRAVGHYVDRIESNGPDDASVRFVFLCGRQYADPVVELLRNADSVAARDSTGGRLVWTFDEPLRGKQIGERLQWLRRQLDARVN